MKGCSRLRPYKKENPAENLEAGGHRSYHQTSERFPDEGSSSSTEQCSVYEIVEEEPQVSGDVDNQSKDRRRQQR